MNGYDPMKDRSGGQESPRPASAGEESPRIDHTTSDGREYTNPDGTHGCIYNDRSGPVAHGARHLRGALVVCAAVIIAGLLLGACCIGGLVALRTLWDTEDGTPSEEIGTSGGLWIFDDSSGGGDDLSESDPAGDDAPVSGSSGGALLRDPSVPVSATIHKLSPKREDKNGDGKPDVAYDQNGEVLTSAGSGAVSVATVVARVSASVVEITTETIVQSGHIGQYISSGAGSGVIISSEGFVVTNHHVIDGASTITVRMNDGAELPATLVGSDERTDIAILWIDPTAHELTVATLGASFDLVVGEDILAIGNPLGSLGGTVTEGMISATARQINVSGTDMTLLQISAPINPGNSGGGLFNLAGELVGIVNAKMSSEEIEGLAFAIPVDAAYDVILELVEYGYVRGRPSVGFSVVDVSDYRTAVRYFNSYYTGVYVSDREHDTLLYGDLILEVNGQELTTGAELRALIDQKKVGDTVELTIYRNQREMTVTVSVVEERPASAPAA